MDMRKLIFDAVEKGEKRNIIRVDLLDKFFKVPTNNAVNNAIMAAKNLLYSKLNLAEIEKYCEEHTAIPEDEHDPFVLDYHKSSFEDDSQRFKYVISTNEEEVVKKNHACATMCDSTYKMNTDKYPVIVLGSTDKDNKFHLFGFGFVSHEKEDTDDYEFCFRALKKGAEQLNGVPYHPKVLISDGDLSIHNGFRKVFGDDCFIKMCFVHVLLNVLKTLTKIFQQRQTKLQSVNGRYQEAPFHDIKGKFRKGVDTLPFQMVSPRW